MEMTLVKMVFAVIFFAIVTFIIFKIFPNLLQQIAWTLGVVKLSNIEKAVLCSIYRCTDGCMSMKVQEISWREKDKLVHCQDFCSGLPDDAYLLDMWGNVDPDLKVCNPNYPVKISLEKPERIEKSHLRESLCMIDSNSYGKAVISVNMKFIYLNKSIIQKLERESCGKTLIAHMPVIEKAIKAAQIAPGAINISSEYGWCPVPWCLGWSNLVIRLEPAQS